MIPPAHHSFCYHICQISGLQKQRQRQNRSQFSMRIVPYPWFWDYIWKNLACWMFHWIWTRWFNSWPNFIPKRWLGHLYITCEGVTGTHHPKKATTGPKNPGWLGYIGRSYGTQLRGNYFINDCKDPVIKQPGWPMESVRGFFFSVAQINSMQPKRKA